MDGDVVANTETLQPTPRQSSSERPDILLVVLDCVRASDFPDGARGSSGMPWVDRILGESVAYRNAVTVAPWTLPAHASLFTGLYPWEHGCHAKGSLVFESRVPRLPSLLQHEGYETFSLSANPFIGSLLGFVEGFDRAAWGGWWESYLRLPREAPPQDSTDQKPNPSRPALQLIRESPLGEMMLRGMDDAYRFPFLLDGANRFFQGLIAPQSKGDLRVAPWIEPTFERWLRGVPLITPTFTFVNFVDAHEPYYADPAVVGSRASWASYLRCRQDHLKFVAGRWTLSPARGRLLHELYRSAILRMDARLAKLADILRSVGRWDNTLMIITSDHGQAFGEHGMLFHMFRPDEAELRIPLVVRPPGGVRRRVSESWVSLVDVTPTLLRAAGAGIQHLETPHFLEDAVDQRRIDPVLAMADGLIWDHVRKRFDPSRRAFFDRVWGVSYDGRRKVLADGTGQEVHAFDPLLDPNESRDLWPTEQAALGPLAALARDVGQRLLTRSPAPLPPEIEDRLRSWGY
jgi:arylsulfatase A-like enzyme